MGGNVFERFGKLIQSVRIYDLAYNIGSSIQGDSLQVIGNSYKFTGEIIFSDVNIIRFFGQYSKLPLSD